MIVLGIDPGSRKTGYAVVEKKNRRVLFKASGLLLFHQERKSLDRAGPIYQAMTLLVEQYHPTHIAIESLIHVKNVGSLMKLAEARGAMMASFIQTHKGKVFEYAPNVIKQAVAGHGHASKESMETILEKIFKGSLGKNHFKTHDESDALAIALCHTLQVGKGLCVAGRKGRSLREAFKHRE